MAQTSSLNCLSCRNPYQTTHSLNCLPPFHWKVLRCIPFPKIGPTKGPLTWVTGCCRTSIPFFSGKFQIASVAKPPSWLLRDADVFTFPDFGGNLLELRGSMLLDDWGTTWWKWMTEVPCRTSGAPLTPLVHAWSSTVRSQLVTYRNLICPPWSPKPQYSIFGGFFLKIFWGSKSSKYSEDSRNFWKERILRTFKNIEDFGVNFQFHPGFVLKGRLRIFWAIFSCMALRSLKCPFPWVTSVK